MATNNLRANRNAPSPPLVPCMCERIYSIRDFIGYMHHRPPLQVVHKLANGGIMLPPSLHCANQCVLFGVLINLVATPSQ